MQPYIPKTMKAAAIDRYGGPEVLQAHVLPVPRPRSKEILIRLEAAGIGVWDADIRAGEFESGKSRFPKVLGNDGAGTVVAVGQGVERTKVGDRVYAYAFKGGFYAQYVAVKQDEPAIAPPNVPTEEAGALGADGVTALIGLEDKLRLRKGEQLLVFGASGGDRGPAGARAQRKGGGGPGGAAGEEGGEAGCTHGRGRCGRRPPRRRCGSSSPIRSGRARRRSCPCQWGGASARARRHEEGRKDRLSERR